MFIVSMYSSNTKRTTEKNGAFHVPSVAFIVVLDLRRCVTTSGRASAFVQS